MATNLKGGYAMLDGEGLDLTTGETPVTIPGIFAKAKTMINGDKPIVAYNLKYSTAPVSPINCFGWALSATEIVLVLAMIQVHIKSDDSVTTLNVAA